MASRKTLGIGVLIGLGIAVGVVWAVAFGLFALSAMSDPPIPPRVAVTTVGHHVMLVGCPDVRIGSVTIQGGASGSGRVVWAAKTLSEYGDNRISLERTVPGYSVSHPSFRPLTSGRYAVADATSVNHEPLLDIYLLFRPSDLRPGFVYTSSGQSVPIATWLHDPRWC